MYIVTGTDVNPPVDNISTLIKAKIICLQKYFTAINNIDDVNSRRVIYNFGNGDSELLFLIRKM